MLLQLFAGQALPLLLVSTQIAPAGDTQSQPCINKYTAILLDDMLHEAGIKGGCQRMFTEKSKSASFKKWKWPTKEQRLSASADCPELSYDGKEVLPTNRWLSVVEDAHLQVQAQPSSSRQQSSAKVAEAVLLIVGKHFCIDSRHNASAESVFRNIYLSVSNWLQHSNQTCQGFRSQTPKHTSSSCQHQPGSAHLFC